MKRLLLTIGLAGMVALAGCSASGTTTASSTTSNAVATDQTAQPNGAPPQGNQGAPSQGDMGTPPQDDGTRAGGQVESVSDTTIKITGRDDTTKEILTTSTTTFTLDGNAATLSDIAAGQFVMAEGTTDDSGVFTATSVTASASQPQGGPGGGNGGGNGGGPGGPPPADGTPPSGTPAAQ
ncbi:MAG: hypothetical protein HGA65_19840 [Oscillochloris sp.]|nr:hypothetical protein [Oscillochloris sp.]